MEGVDPPECDSYSSNAMSDHRPAVRDLLWAAMAVTVGCLFLAGLVAGVIDAIRNGGIQDLVVVLIIGGPVAFWLGVGAWRRTTWGSPSKMRSPALGAESRSEPNRSN